MARLNNAAKERRSDRKWRKVRDAAYRRDKRQNACCWICGKAIDYDLKAGDPYAYEADHEKPWARYPELRYSLSNLRPSHSICNRRRGDGTGSDRIGPSSREW